MKKLVIYICPLWDANNEQSYDLITLARQMVLFLQMTNYQSPVVSQKILYRTLESKMTKIMSGVLFGHSTEGKKLDSICFFLQQCQMSNIDLLLQLILSDDGILAYIHVFLVIGSGQHWTNKPVNCM